MHATRAPPGRETTAEAFYMGFQPIAFRRRRLDRHDTILQDDMLRNLDTVWHIMSS
jgi:hypothetical protein